jgi:hypothetical protein
MGLTRRCAGRAEDQPEEKDKAELAHVHGGLRKRERLCQPYLAVTATRSAASGGRAGSVLEPRRASAGAMPASAATHARRFTAYRMPAPAGLGAGTVLRVSGGCDRRGTRSTGCAVCRDPGGYRLATLAFTCEGPPRGDRRSSRNHARPFSACSGWLGCCGIRILGLRNRLLPLSPLIRQIDRDMHHRLVRTSPVPMALARLNADRGACGMSLHGARLTLQETDALLDQEKLDSGVDMPVSASTRLEANVIDLRRNLLGRAGQPGSVGPPSERRRIRRSEPIRDGIFHDECLALGEA